MDTYIQIESDEKLSALSCLLGHGAKIAALSEGGWLCRVHVKDEADQRRVDCVDGQRFVVEGSHWLVPSGQRVSTSRLEDNLKWKSLDSVLDVSTPAAILAGRAAFDRQPLKLVRVDGKNLTNNSFQADAVIVSVDDLKQWVATASQIRLSQLTWVVRGENALVVGTPIPPIQAIYLQENQRVLVPCGLTWSPEIPVADVRRLFNMSADEWLVWESEDCWSRVAEESLVPLDRASIRTYVRELATPNDEAQL